MDRLYFNLLPLDLNEILSLTALMGFAFFCIINCNYLCSQEYDQLVVQQKEIEEKIQDLEANPPR